MVHTWAKNYVEYDVHGFEPVYIFLSGSGGAGKSHLVKLIYSTISKTLLYNFKYLEKPRVILLEPAGMSLINTSATTIHSGHAIKPGTKLLGLNNK